MRTHFFQVLSRLFASHIVSDFEVGSNPYTKYRALNLHSLDTSLSGMYSCRYNVFWNSCTSYEQGYEANRFNLSQPFLALPISTPLFPLPYLSLNFRAVDLYSIFVNLIQLFFLMWIQIQIYADPDLPLQNCSTCMA